MTNTNSLTEEIKLPKITRLDLSNNNLQGSIPSELVYLRFVPNFSINLFGNDFTGSLPLELCPWLCDTNAAMEEAASMNATSNIPAASSTATDNGRLYVDCTQIDCACNCTS